MKNFSKKLSVLLISAALLTSQSAFAARMGKSRSLGMQRSTPTQTTNNNYQSGANAAPASAAPQKSGPGIGGVVAGAAAGAVGGYMLGKAMNSDKSASSQAARETASSGSNIPWGIIGILGILLAIGLMLFRKKSIPQAASGNLATPQTNNNFNIPNIRKDNSAYVPGQTVQANNQQTAPTVNPAFERMADGVEAQYFLRQAKGMFLHIQSMNTPENVSEVEKYMTPELYAEVKQLISENDYIADFSQLDCQLLASSAENGNFIASVKFFGKVSESPNTPAVDFSEIWNFIKPATVEGAKWLVAGIQQTNSIN